MKLLMHKIGTLNDLSMDYYFFGYEVDSQS